MVNPISYQPQQAFSGGADFSQLANLGNVYRDAQAAQAKRSALANLGTDPQANLQTLLTSGDPALAQLGLSLQQKGIEQAREDKRYSVTDARANAQLALQQASGRRAQGDWEQAEKDRLAVPGLIAGYGAAPAQAAAPASPFPAPLPNAPAPQASPPQATPPPPQAIPEAAPPAPSAFEATPRLPAELQPAAPPVKAEGGDELPGWVQSAQASPPDTSIIGRVASNLTSAQPAAAAGVTREQLGAMYANPLTKPLATAMLQKLYDPGAWTYAKLDDGRLIATNSRDPSQVRDVTPPTATGAPPATKDQRERDARFSDAKARGYDDATANYVAINGKLPKEDLTPTEMKAVSEAEKQVTAGRDVLDNLTRLKTLSPTAWSGWGASKRAAFANAVLPNEMVPQGALDTTELSNLALQNVAGQAKAMFGARLAVAEVKLLNEIETTPEMSDATRQRIYTRIERLINRHVDAAQAEAEGIRNKTYYKPGAAAAPTKTTPTWSIEQ